MEFVDDLKTNFRSWERGCDNEEDAESLFQVMSLRHPDADPEILRDWCYEWVGYDPDEDDMIDHWIDPAGGVHPYVDPNDDDDFYDPAKMYE